MHLTDEQIWDSLGILADGDWTVKDVWDHAQLLGVTPAALFPDCYQPTYRLSA